MNGKYIVFEGIDGCGKSTQSHRLAQVLADRGHKVVWTREPGGVDSTKLSSSGVDIRKFVINAANDCAPATLELLLQADRAEHSFRILQHLQQGAVVISDRSFISGLAYGQANGHSYEDLIPVVDFAVDVLPDYTIFLDCAVKTAFGRMNDGKGAKTREERRGPGFMTTVRQNFLDLLFSPTGRDHNCDVLRQFDDVCSVKRISTENRTQDQVALLVDEFLGLA